VGSLTGQIARLLGAGRVIGSTGSPWKAEQMTADLGYDAAVVRGAGPLAEQLAKAAPDGIDVFIDNVGGEDLRAAVTAARPSARADRPRGGRGPPPLDPGRGQPGRERLAGRLTAARR
jgi:NADPH-dependent curcumin reductase CurA